MSSGLELSSDSVEQTSTDEEEFENEKDEYSVKTNRLEDSLRGCVVSFSARVRRESWDLRANFHFFFTLAPTFAQLLDWKRLLRRLTLKLRE